LSDFFSTFKANLVLGQEKDCGLSF